MNQPTFFINERRVGAPVSEQIITLQSIIDYLVDKLCQDLFDTVQITDDQEATFLADVMSEVEPMLEGGA